MFPKSTGELCTLIHHDESCDCLSRATVSFTQVKLNVSNEYILESDAYPISIHHKESCDCLNRATVSSKQIRLNVSNECWRDVLLYTP